MVGDIVRVKSKQIEDGFAAAILFLLPIFWGGIFYCITLVLGGAAESILSIGLAVLGGTFGFVQVMIFDKIFRKLNPPQILKE
jgi:positive regulator of sigma E activity